MEKRENYFKIFCNLILYLRAFNINSIPIVPIRFLDRTTLKKISQKNAWLT